METYVIRSVERIKELLDEELEVALLEINEEEFTARMNNVLVDYDIAKKVIDLN